MFNQILYYKTEDVGKTSLFPWSNTREPHCSTSDGWLSPIPD